MIDPVVIEKLREKYPGLHPLMFQRSVEHARDAGELFEILDSFTHDYPAIWDEETHRWKKQDDLIRVAELNKMVQK